MAAKLASETMKKFCAAFLAAFLLVCGEASGPAQPIAPKIALDNAELHRFDSTKIRQQYDLLVSPPEAMLPQAELIRYCTCWTAGTSR